MTTSLTRTTPVKTATATDADRVFDVIVLAFMSDPFIRRIFPEPWQYLTHFPEVVRIFGGRALEHGTAYYAGDYAGAALWLPPGIRADDEALAALLHRSVGERDQAEAFAVLEEMEVYHPREPHWYLPVIGVDPTQQGRGYGSTLLEHTLRLCDRDHVPAYLEASSPLNRQLYERHGFEAVATIQVGTLPPVWPMVRKPR
jgi:GNAT superfamily N-acetyltransferase